MTTVLIIEDNAAHMELAARVLEKSGHQVLRASNAEDGLRLAAAHQPRLVLMDMRLPRMDGLTAIRRLKSEEATRTIKIIALTSYREEETERAALAAGADAFLAKPHHYQELLDVLAAVLESGPAGA